MLRTILCCLIILSAPAAWAVEQTPVGDVLQGRKFFTVKPQHRMGGVSPSVSAQSATALKPLVSTPKTFAMPKRAGAGIPIGRSHETPPEKPSTAGPMSQQRAQQILAIFAANE